MLPNCGEWQVTGCSRKGDLLFLSCAISVPALVSAAPWRPFSFFPVLSLILSLASGAQFFLSHLCSQFSTFCISPHGASEVRPDGLTPCPKNAQHRANFGPLTALPTRAIAPLASADGDPGTEHLSCPPSPAGFRQ